MGAPLLIHLMFHPASVAARALAVTLHRGLNNDLALPGLRVPTVLLAEDGTNLPPADHDLNEAEHAVVILLADDNMVVEQKLPEGRRSWGEFAADLADRCAGGRHRFLPVQLSEAAWPLDQRLSNTNFIRGFDKSDAERAAWIERRLVIEMCRFLLGQQRGEKAPIRVFLSHAKHDITAEPKLFETVAAHLNATQPVETWVDSSKIESGGNFAIAIEAGVRDSAVLILATTSYSRRPWCRREVLVAKQHARPVVVVDGLQGLDIRSFPYVGNVPVMAWGNGGAPRAVDLLLKEQLRHLHAGMLLKRQARPQDQVLPVPPELATIVQYPKDITILYPDPPLGDEELEVLAPLGHRMQTPLQRAGADRSLAKKKIALSISETDTPERLGLLPEHLDAALLEISRHLLVKGTSLVYGGHLGSDGYTLALFDLVLAHQQLTSLPAAERIVNYVGWPLPLTTEARARFRWQATFERTPRPAGIEALDPATFVAEPAYFPASNPERRYAWARGMSLMREQQTANIDARIVLGGKVGPTMTATPDGGKKVNWYSGRIPGVIEEALLTLQAGRPTYLCGAFGGAAALVIELLQGRVPPEFTWEFQKQAPHTEAMVQIYRANQIPWQDYEGLAAAFKDIGISGLSQGNHLSEDENRELFRCRDIPGLVELLLTGLSRALGPS
jgi:hypothetical protein